MENTFRSFLDSYLESWRSSSLDEMKEAISKEYKAREVSDGFINDFGYEESIKGWEQGFNFAKDNNAQWELKEVAIIPLKEIENMAIISAYLVYNGKRMENSNLFMQTFRLDEQDNWKLIRSYIEAGLPQAKLNSYQFN